MVIVVYRTLLEGEPLVMQKHFESHHVPAIGDEIVVGERHIQVSRRLWMSELGTAYVFVTEIDPGPGGTRAERLATLLADGYYE